MFAPSKKIIFLIAIVALIGGIILLLRSSKKITYIAPVASVTPTESPLLAKDSDGDALKDWEEELWKTDPLKADTDDDGTSDGVEIKEGRNPLIAGPNDKLDLDTIEKKINTETEKDLSDTTKFSRDLFLKIIAAKKSGVPPTEGEISAYLSKTITEETRNQKRNYYGSADFSVDTEETTQSIKNYGNEIAEILTKNPPVPLEHEMVIVDRAQTKNDPSELKALVPLIAQYKRILSDLLKTTVPVSAVSAHIELANGISGMIYSISGLQYIFSDPIKSLPGISSYSENFQKFIAATQTIKRYFSAANITFEKGERGYNFFDTL